MFDYIFSHRREHVPYFGKLGPIDKNIFDRAIQKITPITTEPENLKTVCWVWNGTVDSRMQKGHQHGMFWYNRKYVLIHRLMYHNFIDDVPIYQRRSGSLQVNHTCSHENNGRCINPWHMCLGTPKQNIADSILSETKVKALKGEENHMAVFSDSEIRHIKQLVASGQSQISVSRLYGINPGQVSRWVRGLVRNNSATSLNN